MITDGSLVFFFSLKGDVHCFRDILYSVKKEDTFLLVIKEFHYERMIHVIMTFQYLLK